MIAGSINSGDVLREITAECGFEVDEEGAAVIDHLNYDVLDQGKVMLKIIVFETVFKTSIVFSIHLLLLILPTLLMPQ